MAEQQAVAGEHKVSFWVRAIPYIILLILTICGVAYTNIEPANSLYYWQGVIPVFCLLTILIGLRSSRLLAQHKSHLIICQLFHWLGVLGVMRLLYVHEVQILIDSNITAIIMMYILALGSYLAGLYINWRLCVVGVFIAIGGLAAAFIEEVAVLMMVVLAVVLVLVFALWNRFGSKRG